MLSLALGIGANTAIFSLIHSVLMKSLPVSNPDGLVVLTSYAKDEKIGDFGYGDFLALRRGGSALSGVMAASRLAPVYVGTGGDAEVAQRKIVSADYFTLLGVQAVAGRTFQAGDDEQPVAVISHGWWTRNFGGADSVVGRQMEMDGRSFTIVGVAEPSFLGETIGESADVWASIELMPPSQRNAAGFTWLNLMARLKPGVSLPEASRTLSRLTPEMPNRFIQRIEVESGRQGSVGLRASFRTPLAVLMGVVAIALTIACANLAGLLLARAANRRKEIATRLAIGASRARVFRQLITESVFLAVIGGCVGLLFAVWAQRALLSLVAGVGRTVVLDVRPDGMVLLFTGAVSILAGVLFGLAPAAHSVRGSAGHALSSSAFASTGSGRSWGMRHGLLVFQIALSMMLLVVGGLFIRTLQNLKNQDLGLRVENVLSVRLRMQPGQKADWPSLTRELLRRIEAIPGVQSASAAANAVLANQSGIQGFRFDGGRTTSGTGVERAQANWVAPRYFETLGLPIVEGREFLPSDRDGSSRVAILNQTMALRYLGTERAVGKRFVFNDQSYEVVGIAKDSKYKGLRDSAAPFVYFAGLQGNSAIHSLEVRTGVAPLALSREIRRAAQETDPRLRVLEVATLEQRMEQMLAREVMVAKLAGFFGGLTLVLVALGVYGTLAYSVARRSKEIGIRIALGGRISAVAGRILGDVLLVGAVGLLAGVMATLAAGQLVRSLLFGLQPTDPMTLGLAAVVLGLATLAAGSVPVLRAVRVNPTVALRLE